MGVMRDADELDRFPWADQWAEDGFGSKEGG
jgi:hypothetical protein